MPFLETTINFGIKTFSTSIYWAKMIGDLLKEVGCNWIYKVAILKHIMGTKRHAADMVVIVGIKGTGFKNEI